MENKIIHVLRLIILQHHISTFNHLTSKMFAVPGWSVDSSSLKQHTITTKPNAQKSADKAEGVVDAEGDGVGKKRKRSGLKDVNKDNLSDMWEQVIEGKPKQKKAKAEREREKKIVPENGAPIPVADGVADIGSHTKQVTTPMIQADVVQGDKKAKKSKNGKKKADISAATATPGVTPTELAPSPTMPLPATKLTPLQAAMRQKLISARFRHLNQTLYTTPSTQSLDLVTSNPEMFAEYHEGFRRQVEVWPENPVDGYISSLLSRGAIRGSVSKPSPSSSSNEAIVPLPRSGKDCTIADLGCGDAAIATALQPHLKKFNLKIHSFDLHSHSPLITKADIASLPLADASVDVAIFCLALMGTNWVDFIEEAFRILRWKGELWISEIKSRFGRVGGPGGKKVVDHSVGKRQKPQFESKDFKKSLKTKQAAEDDAFAAVEVDGQPSTTQETDVSAFVEVLRKRGFVLKGEGQPGKQKEGVDLSNRMFVKMWFVKSGKPIKGKGVPVPVGMEAATGQGTWKAKPKKGGLVEEVMEESVSSEAGVLKPCVYKLR